jgi:DNA-binding winged helix-turn-helix (wHTH) protein
VVAYESLESRSATLIKFGLYELDLDAGQLRKEGRPQRLQPQPFKLLWLLASNSGRLLSRDEIRAALWTDDTYVDFDQSVNFAIRQVREALTDNADAPLYVQTVPKRGYRFIAPVEAAAAGGPRQIAGSDLNLQKVLWTNIAELRMAEARRVKSTRALTVALAAAVVTAIGLLIWAVRLNLR